MSKVQIDIPVLLPEVPDEKDHCVARLLEALNRQRGIERAHLKENGESQICIHYRSQQISLERVHRIASRQGAELTRRFRHLVLPVKGVRHARHARRLEKDLVQNPGILFAGLSAGGQLRVEWDQDRTDERTVHQAVVAVGLRIREKAPPHTPEDAHTSAHILDFRTRSESIDLYFAIGSGICWITGFILSYFAFTPPLLITILYTVALVLGGYFTLLDAFNGIRKGEFDIDFLMLVAAAGATALGNLSEGALLLFLFSLGHGLEHYAMNRARKSISALTDLTPDTAVVQRNDRWTEVPVEELQIGDRVQVKPNSKIAADGLVAKGASAVNQAPITGESVPVEKFPLPDPGPELDFQKLKAEHKVYAGTINGSHILEVRVLRLTADSTLSRLVELVRAAETQKSPTQRFSDRFERYFVPIVLGFVALLHFAFLVLDETFAESFYRAMAVLVAASPCALAISTPSAVLAGVARAARQGVLIKGGRPLEDLGSLSAIAFDKTGTLTEGKPRLTEVVAYGDTTETELLETAVAVEALSDHPLAAAIVAGGKERLGKEDLPRAEALEALTARGVKAQLGGDTVHIGNRRLFKELTGKSVPEEIDRPMSKLESGGHTAMIIHRGDRYLGIVAAMDVARPETKSTLATLKRIGIRRMVMLTGDHQQVANAIATGIGITHPMGNLLPEDKVAAIEKLKDEEGKVAMVGDGVNDAPAMARSTVGIAMGAAGSDVALETADIALMADKLDNLPFAIGLSRKSHRIIRQNIFISLGMVAVLVPLTTFGITQIGWAVVLHEGSTLVVVLNALRLLAYRGPRLS